MPQNIDSLNSIDVEMLKFIVSADH